MSHIPTVTAIYEAFGNGDIPAALAHMTDDIAWEPELPDYGLPWLKPGRGKAHVEAFAATLMTTWTSPACSP